MLKITLKLLLLLLLTLPVALLLAGRLGFLQGHPPADLGIKGGRLKPPSTSPNSVSSQATLYPDHPMRIVAEIAPLPLRGSGAQTLTLLERLVDKTPGGRVVERQEGYLRAEFSSRWLRFVDDTEFWFDPQTQRIEVRSASRLGREDLGVNRARIEALRAQLAAG